MSYFIRSLHEWEWGRYQPIWGNSNEKRKGRPGIPQAGQVRRRKKRNHRHRKALKRARRG